MLTFENVVDDSLLWYLENWSAFMTFITERTRGGSDQVKMDLTLRQLTFLPKLVKRDDVVVPLHVLAVIDGEHTTWAWATDEFADKPAGLLSTRVRDFGQQAQVPFFADADHTSEHPGHGVALAAAACRITGMPVAHLMPRGAQTLLLALDPAGFVPPVASRTGFATLLSTGLATGMVTDGRRAVQGYAQSRAVPYLWGEGFGHLDLNFADGEQRVTFDDQGRPQFA